MKIQQRNPAKSKIAVALSDTFSPRVGLHLMCGVALMSMTGVVQAQLVDSDSDGVPDHIEIAEQTDPENCLLYTSPSPRDS